MFQLALLASVQSSSAGVTGFETDPVSGSAVTVNVQIRSPGIAERFQARQAPVLCASDRTAPQENPKAL